jgi:hypothetical protein
MSVWYESTLLVRQMRQAGYSRLDHTVVGGGKMGCNVIERLRNRQRRECDYSQLLLLDDSEGIIFAVVFSSRRGGEGSLLNEIAG